MRPNNITIATYLASATRRYLYEVRQQEGIKRLIKVVQGVPYELGTKQDGGSAQTARVFSCISLFLGYLNGVWYTVRIELKVNMINVRSNNKCTKYISREHL